MPRPFGAGVHGTDRAPRPGGPGSDPGREPGSESGGAADGASAASPLGAFLAEDPRERRSGGLPEELSEGIVRALGSPEVQRTLAAPFGPACGDVRFAPGAPEIAAAGTELDGPEGAFPVTAVALRPSEPFARLGARIERALRASSRVALLGHGALPDLASALSRSLQGVVAGATELRGFEGPQADLLRTAAEQPRVALDLVDFDPVDGERLGRLRRLRELAAPEGPTAPILSRPGQGRRVLVGRAGATDGDRVLDDLDLGEAAEQVVEEAYGRSALGGLAGDRLAQVWVDPRCFSRFTACLLEVLEEAEGDPWFTPAPWVDAGGPDAATAALDVAAARRVGLDEGATLIHERPGSDGRLLGVVFTNVEPRMRLGGSVFAPGTLTLSRSDAARRPS